MSKRNKFIVAAAVLVAAPLIYAANVHFKRNPTFTNNGTTLTACFSLAGLGNQDLLITLDTSGSATTFCISPGGNQAPGQNKTPVHPSGSTSIPASEIKNGTVSVCVTTQPPPTPTAKEAGCPNNNWTTRLASVDFTSATITVTQGGQVVLQQTFTP
jgi:hypothetical protein